MGFQGSLEQTYLYDAKCCHLPDDCCDCKDAIWWYGLCAYPCVQGLMLQELRKNSTKREDAGCSKGCYVEGAYPCVCTDSCWLVTCCNCAIGGAGKAAGGRLAGRFGGALLGQAGQAAVGGSIRSQLIRKAEGPQDFVRSWEQAFCWVCCCTHFQDAAFVIEKHKEQMEERIAEKGNTNIQSMYF